MPLFTAPYKHTPVTFAGNRCIVKIAAATPAQLGANVRASLIYRCKVYVQEFRGSAKFILAAERIAHEEGSYVKNGVTYFPGASWDISDVLLAYIPDGIYNLDQYTGGVLPTSIPNEYLSTVKYYTEIDIQTLATTPIVSPIQLAINAKLSKRKFASWKNTFFTSRMDDLGNFLTWAPTTKYISKTQNEYLFFLQNFTPSPVTLGLDITYIARKNTGATVDVHATIASINFSGNFEKLHTIPVGYNQLATAGYYADEISLNPVTGLTGAETELVGYKIKIIKFGPEVTLSEPRTFMIKEAGAYTSRFVTFKNSLGTYDTLAFNGKSTESAALSRATVEKAIKNDGLPTMPELETVAVNGVHEITLNTGYYEHYDSNYLLELMYSDDVRLQTDEGLIPIQLGTESLKYTDEREFLRQREFQFTFVNTEIAGSYLGVAPAVADRPVQWIGIEPFCTINDFGIYSGSMKFNSLELHYADGALELVEGSQPKLNGEGTDGYIAPSASPQCLAALTPITNTVQTKLGTYRKNTCIAPQIGDYPTITIAAGTYGGATLGQANQRALDAIKVLDTQEYANIGAGAAACITGPWAYSMGGIPANFFNLRWGQRPTIDSERLTGLAGGVGVNSSDPTQVIYGNTWYCFGNSNPSSIYHSPLLFDNLLPIAPGTDYVLDVYTSVAKTVTIYKNGISVLVNNVTLGDIAGTGYKRITLSAMTYLTGDKYYIDIV